MKKIYKAIADFQQEVPAIHKGTQGYGYSYASLSEIYEVILPLLKKHGLGFIQPIEGTSIKTVVFHHESGEQIESTAEIPQDVQLAKMNPYQVMGSAITYFRRYTLSSMLGLITDVDNDAQGEFIPAPKAEPKAETKPYPTNKQIERLLERAEKEGGVKVLEEASKHFRIPKQLTERLNDMPPF